MEEKGSGLRILIIAYYSINDPVFRSSIFNYFKEMDREREMHIHLLTFENEKCQEWMVTDIKKEGFLWKKLHSPKRIPKPFRKIRDLWRGINKGVRIVKREGVDLIYSEGFPSAIIGYHVSQRVELPHVVHTFEPHSEYMAEAGVWSRKSWEYRVISHYEKKVERSADILITGSKRMKNNIEAKGIHGKAFRLPSCVDLSFFKFEPEERKKVRNLLGVSQSALIVTYLGKFGGMYYDKELFAFFRCLLYRFPQKTPYFLIITVDDSKDVLRYAKDEKVDVNRVFVKRLDRSQIPSYLSAADLGLSGMRQSPSKVYASPIKHGEYWGCGLPIGIFRGVSEDDELAEKERCGIVIDRPDQKSYNLAIDRLLPLLSENPKEIRARCRSLALKERSLEKGRQLLIEQLSKFKAKTH